MKKEETSYITLKDIVDIFLGNIWLFVISVALCVGGAFIYIAKTPPTFQRTASILIKDDKKGQSIESAAFESMGLVQSNTDINNEIYILSTSQLMEEVVSRLSLHYNYSQKYKGIRWIDLYHNAPFTVELDDNLKNSYVSLNLSTDGKTEYEIDELKVDGIVVDVAAKGAFGDTITTPYGALSIQNRVNSSPTASKEVYSFTKGGVEGTAAAYSGALSVRLRDANSSIIDMTMTLGSRQKAEDILNMLISVYNENWIKDKNMVSLSTTNFINERLAIITKELGDVDQDISSYKSENLLPDVGAVASMNLASTNEILKQQIELNNQLSMAKYILQYIESSSTSNQLLPVNSGIESGAIDTQIGKYNELLLQKNTLLANSSINNPIVADLIADLESMKKVLVLSMNDLINTLTLQIDNTRKEEVAAQKRLSNNPSQELYLLSTGREQMIKEQLYLFLLQKREENELNQAFTAYNTKVLSLAKGSNAPVAPQKRVIWLFGFAVGCILPIIFLILRMSFNTTISTKEDLGKTQIPFLGSIPQIGVGRRSLSSLFRGKKEHSVDNIVVAENSRDGVTEAFRVVRTNLDFMSVQTVGCKTINITSFNPRSGKSFISLNLAMSMALKNNKVLVIDGDFRRGTLSKSVESPNKGVVNYLNGSETNIDNIIVTWAFHPSLDVLPMGVMPPNPTELLLTDKFASLLDELKSRYDYIFFDCPPVEIVPDAMIVEKFCDSTIFVVRAGLMDKRLLPDMEELYDSKRLKSMSLILNGVDYSRNSRYGYGKYGYGKYGYGKYGYGGYGSYGSKPDKK